MKRIVEEFIRLAENPPQAHQTRDVILNQKEKFNDLKDSMLKIASSFFSVEQLQGMKESVSYQHDEEKLNLRMMHKMKQLIDGMYPESENIIIGMDTEPIKAKISELEKILTTVCSILTTIEIAETTGLIKPNEKAS